MNLFTEHLQFIGMRDFARAKSRAYMCLKIAMTYMSAMGVVFLIFRHPLARAFSDDPAVIQCGAVILIFAALFHTMHAVGIVSSGALRGAGDTHYAAAIAIGCSWGVFLPLGWAFAHYVPQFGSKGPWVAVTIYLFLVGGLLFWRSASEGWRRIDIFATQRPPS